MRLRAERATRGEPHPCRGSGSSQRSWGPGPRRAAWQRSVSAVVRSGTRPVKGWKAARPPHVNTEQAHQGHAPPSRCAPRAAHRWCSRRRRTGSASWLCLYRDGRKGAGSEGGSVSIEQRHTEGDPRVLVRLVPTPCTAKRAGSACGARVIARGISRQRPRGRSSAGFSWHMPAPLSSSYTCSASSLTLHRRGAAGVCVTLLAALTV